MFSRIRFVYILLTAGIFSLPFLYVYHATLQWNPFAISGKNFLVFYGIGIIIGYFTLLLSRKFTVFSFFFERMGDCITDGRCGPVVPGSLSS